MSHYTPIAYTSARHPLRTRMPRSFLRLPVGGKPMGDFQLFLMTFSAGFLAFYGFLS